MRTNVPLLPGISGTLLPARFIAARDWRALAQSERDDARARTNLARRQADFDRWWRGVERNCGPATGIRAIADHVAAPLAGLLGYRVESMAFHGPRGTLTLASPHRVVASAAAARGAMAMIVLPWSSRPSMAWRDLAAHARALGSGWGFVLAPPHLSLVDCRGHAVRRSVEFLLPDAFSAPSIAAFQALAGARNARATRSDTGTTRLDAIVDEAARFADGVRRDLQQGVLAALTTLAGVIDGPPGARFDEALTIVYRVLFLLFAESRDLVPRRHPTYRDAYTVGALASQAVDARRHADARASRGLWAGLGAMTRLSRAGCEAGDLVVRPFNGHLFAREAAPSLEPAHAAPRPTRASMTQDQALGQALVALATRSAPGGRESIDYADLGVEQLGAVYERVLDLDPADRSTWLPPPAARHSRARKESGTFYTPQALCDFVVRRTLTPLVSGATADGILSLRVVDPAMGSGAFLVSACRFLAAAYERALVDEGRIAAVELDEDERADFRRLVAERCLFGVDANGAAVHVARLSLWLATLARGKPLTFLDHRLRVGNSLIGSWPDRLRRVPETTRRTSRPATLPFADLSTLEAPMRDVVRPLSALALRRDDTADDVRAKESAWRTISGADSPLRAWRLAADVWCARWFSPDAGSAAETRAVIDALLGGDRTIGASHLARRLAEGSEVAKRLGFFHWALEFPDVFYDDLGAARDRPGFDAVVGNPPWEMLRRDDGARTTPRPLVNFLRQSGMYPATDRGQVNLYQPFVERALSLARAGGRVGLVLPWGLAVDEGARSLRARLFDTTRLDVVVGLDNAAGLFPIHRGLRFMVVTTQPGGRTAGGRGRFGVRSAGELADLPGGDAELGETPWPVGFATDGAGLGGAARRIPDARRPGDLALAERLAREFPRLGDPQGWGAAFGRELNATEDKAAFGPTGLRVLDGRHLSPFRVAARASERRITPSAAERALSDGRYRRPRLGYRDVSGVGNRVSLIAAIVPAGIVTTHTVFCLRTPLPLLRQHFLCACFNSYVANAIVRLLMGGHVTTGLVEDLPMPVWQGGASDRRLARLAARLARSPWSADLEARLQAAVARRFGLDARTFAALLDGFPLVPAADRERAVGAFTRAGRRSVAI